MSATQPSPQQAVGSRQPAVLPIGKLRTQPAGPRTRATGPSPGVWQEVKLTDINASATLFQFRVALGTADLRGSLESQGQLEPIDLVGEDKPFRIVDGFRRFHAARDLGWASIHAFVHREMGEREALRLAFAKNVVRRNLSPLERANAMHVATSRGMTVPELAGAFGLSERQVRRYLQILELPEAIQEVMDGKVVTMAHGRLLADYKVKDPAEWAERILKEQLDVRLLKRGTSCEDWDAVGAAEETVHAEDGVRDQGSTASRCGATPRRLSETG